MNSIEQLLHDAMTEQTERVPHLRPGSSRRAVLHSRRAHRTRIAVASGATVAATVAVSVVAIGLQPADDTATSGAGSGADPTSAAAPRTAAPATVAVAPTTVGVASSKAASESKTAPESVAPAPAGFSGDTSGTLKSDSDAPAELKAVTLPGPVADLNVTEPSYMLTSNGKWKKWFWFHPDGTEDSSGAVIITRGAAGPLWNQRQSPSPTLSSVNVQGKSGTVWLSGGDREIYYTAGDLTVEVSVSDKNITLDQMDQIADAVQGLPQ